MKMYRRVLMALFIALVMAVPAAFLVRDPGYVLMQYRDTVVESSLLFLLAAIALTIFTVVVLWWLVRWPLRLWIGNVRRRGRQHFQRGVQALAEGRTEVAEELLMKASKLRSLQLPALIGAYDAAKSRQDHKRQGEILQQIDALPEAHDTSAILRAELEVAEQRPGAAIELLTTLDQHAQLPPAGLKILIQALRLRQRAREAVPYLIRLRKAQILSAQDLDRLETDTLSQALTQASDVINLRSMWAELTPAQRSDQRLVNAYASRAGALHLTRDAMNEIEAAQKLRWSNALAETYGQLPVDLAEERLKTAETWFAQHNTSPELLLALGRLSRQTKSWGKAEEYVRRAIAENVGAPAWLEMALAYAEQGDAERARIALENARAAERGDRPQPLTARTTLADLTVPAAVAEARNEFGMPQLPGVR